MPKKCDICHFCTKRVYVMERLSAEGYFFHRECFRCDVCNCTLRLGGHTFDSQEGKFYCKMHDCLTQADIGHVAGGAEPPTFQLRDDRLYQLIQRCP
uniref:LIM zinc-binding domain-containing protein n=1 Tax=Labrus bergylta TaxID=56723 RepID=A0A3Q3MVF1_9LABR